MPEGANGAGEAVLLRRGDTAGRAEAASPPTDELYTPLVATINSRLIWGEGLVRKEGGGGGGGGGRSSALRVTSHQ